MAIMENLFGEFVDCILGIDPVEAIELGAQYTLYGGHTIGFWMFVGLVVVGITVCCLSKRLRSKFF